MTNSATSTKGTGQAGAGGFQGWQFFALASLMGATAVVLLSPQGSHPVALLVVSAAALSAGLVGAAISRAVAGFFSGGEEPPPLPPALRDELEREKHLVLRSIKELEFDKGMGKVSAEDYAAIMARLRARAVELMRDLDRASASPASSAPRAASPSPAPAAVVCRGCRTSNDVDARFCKTCGAKLGGAA